MTNSVRGVAKIGRSRAERVEANDRALRDAAMAITVEAGWEAVTFTGVAKRAGLTVGAVYGRAENTAELAVDLWQHVAGPWFEDAVDRIIAAGEAGNQKAMEDALARWESAPVMSTVVFELLVASHFDPDMSEVIASDARRVLTTRIDPQAPTASSQHRAAAVTLTLSFAFGRAIALRGGSHQSALTHHQTRVQTDMFAAEQFVGTLPTPRPLCWMRPLDDLDQTHRAVLRGTLDVVGRVGYKRATIARIARAAGVPRGSLLSRYKSKAQLVADAVRQGLIAPREVWAQYEPVVATHGPLTSRAMFLADFLREENRTLWTVNLELARVARVLPDLDNFRPNEHVLENTHLGVMLTASLMPNLADLPFAGPFSAGSAT